MISVIIPTLNEEGYIENTLKNLKKQKGNFETLVIDGGSTDNTIKISKKYSKVYSSKKGRSNQMNYGAKKAKGNVFLFLHADTLLPKNAILDIEKLFKNKETIAGKFYLNFDKNNLTLKFLSLLTRLNLYIISYGDQGIFIGRNTFNKLNGYKNIKIMEDIDLVRRVKKLGKFNIINKAVITSSRRFLKKGTLKQQLINTYIFILFLLGFDVNKLSKLYTEIR